MTRTIIGFTGRKQSGKTTAAKHLIQSGFVGCSFASPMKAMLMGILKSMNLNFKEIDTFMRDDKEKPVPLIGKSIREMMQTLGTEWGRQLVHPDLWVIVQRCKLETLAGSNIVFDDVRFENEAALIRELGGLIVHIDRDIGLTDKHSSELGICDHSNDIFIGNNKSLVEFLADIDFIFSPQFDA